MPRYRGRGNGGPPTGPRGRGGRSGGPPSNNAPHAAHQNERSDQYSKMCDIHGWNASHETKDCKQAQRPAQNQHQNQNQNQVQFQNVNQSQNQNQSQSRNQTPRYCDRCKTTTHDTAYCKRNNSQSTRQPKLPPPINTTRGAANPTWVAPQPSAMEWSSTVPQSVLSSRAKYCIFCNKRNHTKATCSNEAGMRNHFQSTLCCRGCGARGHLSDDCQNPSAARCTKCFRRGHAPYECFVVAPAQNPPVSALRTSFLPTSTRFKWPASEESLHTSQMMRIIYEETLRRLAREGRTMPEEQRLATERQIANAANVFEPGKRPRSQSKVHWGDLPCKTGQPINRRPSSIMIRRPSTRAKDFVSPTRLRNLGMKTPDISSFESFIIAKKEAEVTERQKLIRRKIDSSRVYGLEPVNNYLLRMETRVLELQLVTPQRFGEVKWAIRNGFKFYRDPKAMEALFSRQVPRCNDCAKRGEVLDQHFNVVPASATKNDLLNLSDYIDWGLFVVLSCPCPGTVGYWYQDRTPLELEDLMDDDE